MCKRKKRFIWFQMKKKVCYSFFAFHWLKGPRKKANSNSRHKKIRIFIVRAEKSESEGIFCQFFVTNYACKDDDIVGEANHSRSRPISSIPADEVYSSECTRQLKLECFERARKHWRFKISQHWRRGKNRHPPMYENFHTLSRRWFFPWTRSSVWQISIVERRREQENLCVVPATAQINVFLVCFAVVSLSCSPIGRRKKILLL